MRTARTAASIGGSDPIHYEDARSRAVAAISTLLRFALSPDLPKQAVFHRSGRLLRKRRQSQKRNAAQRCGELLRALRTRVDMQLDRLAIPSF